MKKIVILLIIVLFNFVFANNTGDVGLLTWNIQLSWDKIDVSLVEKRAKAINKFIEREKKLIEKLYKKGSLMLLLDIDEAQKQINNIYSQLNQVSEQLETVYKKKKIVDKKYYEILSGIKLILKDIKSTKEKINQRLIRIKLYSLKIVELKNQISQIRKDLNVLKNSLAIYTKILYSLNNQIYDSDLKIDNLKLLLKSENISKTLSKEDIVKLLTAKMKELMNQLDEKNKKLTYYIKKINFLKIKYASEVKGYQRELEMLNQQKKYLMFLFDYLKIDKKEYDKKFKFLFESKKDLKRQLIKLLLVTRNKLDKIKLWTGFDITPLLKNPEKPDSDKFFSWPVLPVTKITTYFHDPDYLKQFWVLHNAIDLRVPQWSPIYAPANGIVYKVFDQDWPGLNRMIIVHKYWYVTVYLHLNKILVKEGQFVKRGQIIAVSWWKPGTRWAWLLSEGPHLHFEVIKNGQWIDPLKVLDLSVIDFDYKKLPKKYWLKYYKDKLSRNIDLSKVKVIPWKTILDRRINFLKKYGSWPYKDLQLWQKAASGTKIDIDLWICIWFAETWLGKHFARNSKWNVGNVWNNDRWDRRGFKTPLEGARAIYLTLNNKYLKNIYTLDKLSRYWSSNGPIYASEPYKWQKNVMKCLTMIKWYWVPEDYPFRKLR